MKKTYTLIKFLFIAVAAFFFCSCSKTGNTTPYSGAITGKWNITADTSQTVGYPPYIIVGINSPYMQFNADGSGTDKNNTSTPDVVRNFTYTISKDTVSFNYQAPNSYAIKGIINKLTSNKLVIEYDSGYSGLIVKERIYMSK